ncbi:MAG: hypothetical protein LHV68_12545 [Elusimicrobia bacterium]|nr:hypothetical protein [Candidatus Liberimonas magnetica]
MNSKMPNLQISKNEAKQRLDDQIKKGLKLRGRSIRSKEAYDNAINDHRKWDSYNKELLKLFFDSDEILIRCRMC